MTQPIVQVDHLQICYRKVTAVSDVSFSLAPGEILAVIGANGSGKTSTIECVEGLRKPDRGAIRVFGQDPWLHRREICQKMGVQLQETDYPMRLRVEEVCRLFASFYQRPADWKLLLSQLDLVSKGKRPIHKLSGGEKQRLSILLALMGRPKLILLDELTTGLDPEVRQSLWAAFRRIKSSGISILMISHYLDEVEALADRILYLEKGEQMFFGTQPQFREYAKKRISMDGNAPWNPQNENLSLETLYLQMAPKSGGLTMEGII